MVYFFIFSLISVASELATDQKPSVHESSYIQHGRCPEVLTQLRKEDKEDKFLGLLKNQDKTCSLSLTRKNDIASPYHLYLELQEKYPLSNSIKRRVLSCMKGNEEEARNKVAKYYYYHERLALGNLEKIEQIAAIDSLLPGQKSMANVRCPNASSPKARLRCNELKKCSSKDNDSFDQLAEQAMEAYEDIKAYESLKERLKNAELGLAYRSSKQRIEEYSKAKKEFDLKKAYYEQIVYDNPWVSGEEFKKVLKSHIKEKEGRFAGYTANSIRRKTRLEGVKRALKAQFLKERSVLVKDMGEYRHASECLFGAADSDDCNTKKIRTIINKTPGVDIFYTKDKKKNATAQYLNNQRCLIDAKVDQENVADILTNSAWAAGLTMITGGAALYGASKLALTGAARTVGLAKNSKSITDAYKAQKLGRVILLEKASIAADLSYTAYTSNEVIDACKKEQNQMEKVLKESVTNKNQCPSYKNAGGEVVATYNNCVAAVAGSSLSLLPIAAWAVGPVRRAMQRKAQSQALVSKKNQEKNLVNKEDTQFHVEEISDIKNTSRVLPADEEVNSLVNRSKTLWNKINKFSNIAKKKKHLNDRSEIEKLNTEELKSLNRVDKQIRLIGSEVSSYIKENNELVDDIANYLRKQGYKLKITEHESVLSKTKYKRIDILGNNSKELSARLEEIKQKFGLSSDSDLFENALLGAGGFVIENRLSLSPHTFLSRDADGISTTHFHEVIHGQEKYLPIKAHKEFTKEIKEKEDMIRKAYKERMAKMRKEKKLEEGKFDEEMASFHADTEQSIEDMIENFYSEKLLNLKERAGLNGSLSQISSYKKGMEVLKKIKEKESVSVSPWYVEFKSVGKKDVSEIYGYKKYYRADEARAHHAQARMIVNQLEKLKKGKTARSLNDRDSIEMAKKYIKKSLRFNQTTQKQVNRVLKSFFTKKVRDNIEYITDKRQMVKAKVPIYDDNGELVSTMTIQLSETNSSLNREYNFYETYNYLFEVKRNITKENGRLMRLFSRAKELE